VPPHLSTEIQGASIVLLPILPGCSSARKLGLQPWGMHGVARRCSRLPWRPIVTGHPSPLISPTFYPPCSPGDPPAGQHRPTPSQKHWSLITTAKPLNCLAHPAIDSTSLSSRLAVRSRHRLGCSRPLREIRPRESSSASQPAGSAFVSRAVYVAPIRGGIINAPPCGRSVRAFSSG